MGDWTIWTALRLVLPLLLLAAIDMVALWRALLRPAADVDNVEPVGDFEVLVPIYGSISYLENVEFLRAYGDRVVLCTTSSESEEFYHALRGLMDEHGFRVFVGDVDRAAGQGKRATGGVVRDRLVRDALAEVRAPYVVCIDADTVTDRPLDDLVGAMAAADYEVVSIRLLPSNRGTLLARLQAHEYRIAMDLRRIMPWLVSGACHAGRTEALRDIMSRHSLFFQGNDVETGILADALGYRVGHIPFEVPTTVPERFVPWWRQRLAWAGGGVRLFVANPQLGLKHPFLWLYGLVLGLCMVPLRWDSLGDAGWGLLIVAMLYIACCFGLYRGHWDLALFLMPLYSVVTSIVLIPLGLVWYLKMAWADRNAGLIRPSRPPVVTPAAASSLTR